MPPDPTSKPAPPHDTYMVKDRVAIGTAGVVYRGVQAATGQEVTFKVLSAKSTHPFEPERVLALRWRLEALKHPVIAELLDAYDDPEGFVIVTSWLPGGIGGNDFPVKHRTLTKEEARLVAMRLCGALLAGEQARFPHGDLKPSNLIIADRGAQGLSVQIQDWGLSACREIQPPETLQFMAPERHHGHPASMQGDLFSAGATLWFLLTAEAPAYGATAQEVLQDWGAFNPASLAQKRPDLDDHFRQWLAWLLRWQPGDRPQSVSQALDVLNQVVGYAAAVEAQSKKPAPAAAPPAEVVASPPPSAPAPAAAAPPATKPAGPRAAPPRLHLPVAPAAPPPSTSPKREAPPPKEKRPLGQRVMAAVMICCLLGGLVIAFVAWAENEYGHDWQKQLAAKWDAWRAAKPQPPATPPPAPTKTPAVVTASKKTAAPQAKPAPIAATKAPAKSAAPRPLALDAFDGSGSMQARTGGTGWKGPWQAEQVTLEKNVAAFGKGPASTAARPMGTLKNLPDDYLTVGILVTHPGKDAAPLKVDVLSPDGKALIAPACVAFEDGKVRVFIEGGTTKLDAPTGKPFRLVVRWDWRLKKKGGKRQVSISAGVDSSPDPNKSAGAPLSKRTLAEQTLPESFLLTIQSTGAAQPVTVGDLRVGRYLRDALP